jgi:hypothetical protein
MMINDQTIISPDGRLLQLIVTEKPHFLEAFQKYGQARR